MRLGGLICRCRRGDIDGIQGNPKACRLSIGWHSHDDIPKACAASNTIAATTSSMCTSFICSCRLITVVGIAKVPDPIVGGAIPDRADGRPTDDGCNGVVTSCRDMNPFLAVRAEGFAALDGGEDGTGQFRVGQGGILDQSREGTGIIINRRRGAGGGDGFGCAAAHACVI